ncbi:MAG TPA: YbaB/EbfC family nucleoid-associated protein [Pseudonocardiaceae bacterium]
MTEPGFTAARVAELQREADGTMAALADRITAAAQVRERAMSVSGKASSQDGSVTVVVDSTGVVTSLTLAPTVFDRTTPEKLASTLVAVIQQAATRARTDMAAAMAPLRAGGDAARKAAAGVPELSALRFDVPEVPHTAVDRSGAPDPWAGVTPDAEPTPAPAPGSRRGPAPAVQEEADDAPAQGWVNVERPW